MISHASQRKEKEIKEFSPSELVAGGSDDMALYIAKGIAAAHGGTLRMFEDVHGRDGEEVSVRGPSGSSTCHFIVHLPLLALPEDHPVPPRLDGSRKGSMLLFSPKASAKTLQSSSKAESGNAASSSTAAFSTAMAALQSTAAAQDTGVTTPTGAVVDRWAAARPSTDVEAGAAGPQSSSVKGPAQSVTTAPSAEPLLLASPREVATKLSAPPPRPPQPSVTLLVVDDSDLTRKMLCRMVRAKGFQVDEAEDGAVAVEKVRLGPHAYAAILMDFVMPVMDGPTATRAIRDMGYTAPILGVTGNGQDFDVAHFKTMGANEVFTKPLDVPRFLAVLGSNGVATASK